MGISSGFAPATLVVHLKLTPVGQRAGPQSINRVGFSRSVCRRLLSGLIVVVVGVASSGDLPAQGTADYMHRGHGFVEDDALISLFRTVLVQANAGDWNEVARKIHTLDPQLDRYHTLFNVDAKTKLERSIAQRDGNSTARYLAEVVYLGMREEFYVIAENKMSDVVEAKSRLLRAKLYYDRVLAGNVMRRNAERHERIDAQFVLAEAALGNPALFIDLPVMESDLRGFQNATHAIEREIQSVYTYFGK